MTAPSITLTEVCSICNNICHNQCLVEINGVYTCLSCNIRELDETQQNEINAPHENNIVSTDLPTNANVNRLIPKQRKNMKYKPVPRPRKSANKEQSQPDNLKEVKLSELRAREAKLRKAEERLQIKEKSIDELKNEKIMIETRCQHLEARNFELEQTQATEKKDRLKSILTVSEGK